MSTDSSSGARSERRRHRRRQTSLLATINYQRVLLLRLFEGLTAEEVARRMDTTAGAVRMLQMRALTALRELMPSV